MGTLSDMEQEDPLLNTRISTVVPATPRADENGACRLSYVDLLVKLHYIRAVYFFGTEATQGLSTHDLKKYMFPLLDPYFHVSGRIRISETGRPFIKYNDAGVRIAESHRDVTLEEWFHQNGYSVGDLVHDHVLGPDLGFSPLVFVKFTWFKCGGLSVGLSWSHVLGDAFSAFNFITVWSHTLAGHVPPQSLHVRSPKQFPPQNSGSDNKPISVKRATVVGERWLATNYKKVVTHTFHVTPTQLDHLVSATNYQTTKTPSCFAILSALLWKYIAQLREESPKVVTICAYDTECNKINDFPTNGLVLSVVEANEQVGKRDVSELAKLIVEQKMVENHVVEKLVEESDGKEDFIVYGANLTFVDLEEGENLYGVKMNGQKPIVANCAFHGLGDQGVVLVLPATSEDNGDESNGRMITISLPEKELDLLKDKLRREWGIA